MKIHYLRGSCHEHGRSGVMAVLRIRAVCSSAEASWTSWMSRRIECICLFLMTQLRNLQLEMLLLEQKLKGCKWLEGFQPRKAVHGVHMGIVSISHEQRFISSSVSMESCRVTRRHLARLLLNAVSLEELTSDVQTSSSAGLRDIKMPLVFFIFFFLLKRTASAMSSESRPLRQQLSVIRTSVAASVSALISLLLVISERGVQIACQAVPVLVCCAAELMPYYFLRKEAWWTPISRASNQIHRRGN